MKLRLSILAATLVAVILILCRFNPVEYQFFPPCLFHRLTGLSCPGCGMQRFVHALSHGHVAEAVSYNAFLPFVGVFAALVLAERTIMHGQAQQRLRAAVEGRFATNALCIAIVVWFVLRNLLGI